MDFIYAIDVKYIKLFNAGHKVMCNIIDRKDITDKCIEIKKFNIVEQIDCNKMIVKRS